MLTMKANTLCAHSAHLPTHPERLQARQIATVADVPEKFWKRSSSSCARPASLPASAACKAAMRSPNRRQDHGRRHHPHARWPLAPIRCASVTAYRACEDCPEPEACALRVLMGDVRDAMSDVVDHRSLQQLVLDARSLQRKSKRAAAKTSRRPAATPR